MHPKLAHYYEMGVKLALFIRGLHGTNKPYEELAPGAGWGRVHPPSGSGLQELQARSGVSATQQSPLGSLITKHYAGGAMRSQGVNNVAEPSPKGYQAKVLIDTKKWEPVYFSAGHEAQAKREFTTNNGRPPTKQELFEESRAKIRDALLEADNLSEALKRETDPAKRMKLKEELSPHYQYLNRNVLEWKAPETASVTPLSWKKITPRNLAPDVRELAATIPGSEGKNVMELTSIVGNRLVKKLKSLGIPMRA